MGQTPRDLNQFASLRAWYGAELRYWRMLRGLSQGRLAARVHFGEDMIAKVEKAERWPSLEMMEACDAALDTGGILGRLWPMVEQERERRRGRGDDPGSVDDFVASLERIGTIRDRVIYAAPSNNGKAGRRFGGRPVGPSAFDGRYPWQEELWTPDGPKSLRELVNMDGFDSGEIIDHPSKVGPMTLEQMYAAATSLARSFANHPRLEVYSHARMLRQRVFAALDSRHRASESRDLYWLAAAALGMLAEITDDFGFHDTALTHTQAALICARDAGDDALVAWIRALQTVCAYRAGRFGHAVEYARAGQELATSGTVAAWLFAAEARAAGALGDARTVRAALDKANEARDAVVPDRLDEIGGILTFLPAKQHFYAGQAHMWLRQGPATITEAEACVAGYRNGPPEQRAFDNETMAQVNLAMAHVYAGDVEAAREAAQAAFAIPPELHTEPINDELRALHRELCSTSLHDSVVAVELRDQIEDFVRTTHGPELPM